MIRWDLGLAFGSVELGRNKVELRIVITFTARPVCPDPPFNGGFRPIYFHFCRTGYVLVFLPNFYLNGLYERRGNNCLHSGRGKVANGVQLQVVKYRATVLTFIAGLSTEHGS